MKNTIKMLGILALVCALSLSVFACGSKGVDYKGIMEKAGFSFEGSVEDLGVDGAKDGFVAYRDDGDEIEFMTCVTFESKNMAVDYFGEGTGGMEEEANDDEDVSYGNSKVGDYQVAATYDEYYDEYVVAAQRDSVICVFEFYGEDYDNMLKIIKEIGISKLPDMK